jgi:hypothetical protein
MQGQPTRMHIMIKIKSSHHQSDSEIAVNRHRAGEILDTKVRTIEIQTSQ